MQYKELFKKLNTHFNKDLFVLNATPNLTAMTGNSDTPYGLSLLSTKEYGALIVELPEGSIIGLINDGNFCYMDYLGITGADKGKGGKYLVIPPNYNGHIPEGYYVIKPKTYIVMLLIRVVPKVLSNKESMNLIRKLKIYPLNEVNNPSKNIYRDLTDKKLWISTADKYDGKIDYWNELKEVIEYDLPNSYFYTMYGLLAGIGIKKGESFTPDNEIKSILKEAAQKGDEQLFTAAFTSDNSERLVWKDKNWEWVAFGKDPTKYFYFDYYMDIVLRELWYYLGVTETPAMTKREANAGSAYLLGIKDKNREYLDGNSSYKLKIKTPVPADLFWSMTVYDLDTRSEIKTDQHSAIISSLYDDLDKNTDSENYVTIHFDPEKPKNPSLWVQTNKNEKWFGIFRIYGPEEDLFNNNWILEDIEKIS